VAVPGPPEVPVQRVKPSAEGDPTRLRLTPEQQASLPKFQMNVHVYNTDPSRRFILINGLKYGEGARTREGFKVVEIRLDGVVLDHQGHPFFVHR
jgi:general secretion pathway protein B